MSRARAALLAAAAVALLLAAAGMPAIGLLAGFAVVALVVDAVDRRGRSPSPPPSPESSALAVPAGVEALTGVLPHPVLLLDAEERVLAANPAAADLAGRPREELLGLSLIRALRHHALAELVRAPGEVASVAEFEGGRHFRATAAFVETGSVRSVLVLENVTDLHDARRARTDLVGNVSHELRTPLTAARALAETLERALEERDGGGEDHDLHFATKLVAEIDRLGRIVDRLIRLSRLEAAEEPFEVAPLATDALLRDAASRIAPLADMHGVRLEVGGAAPPLRADRERLLEVLSNLLDNALRASPRGGVVTLSAVGDGDEVRVEVTDEGPGILPSERERIFERFYTGDAARATGVAGSGLGLAIARHIMRRLGGRVWVADGGPGATLCVALPRTDDRPTTNESAPRAAP
ncbi:MAG: ATP-binding protein [Chloroflexi bacterium]|nr:ATP-binding protein [Chloroflexota bacterium]